MTHRIPIWLKIIIGAALIGGCYISISAILNRTAGAAREISLVRYIEHGYVLHYYCKYDRLSETLDELEPVMMLTCAKDSLSSLKEYQPKLHDVRIVSGRYSARIILNNGHKYDFDANIKDLQNEKKTYIEWYEKRFGRLIR